MGAVRESQRKALPAVINHKIVILANARLNNRKVTAPSGGIF